MVTVTVNRRFTDVVANVVREPGETFVATDDRGAILVRKLPKDYVSVTQVPDGKPARAKDPAPKPVEDKPDYSKMTNPQLRELIESRGIEVRGRLTKKEMVALLEG